MRRSLNTEEITELLSKNYIGRLGYIANGTPYVIPITYFYDEESKSIVSYSGEGHKIKAMRKNPMVSLEVDQIESIYDWKSVLIHGTYEELERIDAKHVLRQFSDGVKNILKLTEKRDTQFISEFSSKIYFDGNPIVFRIKIDEIRGKLRKSWFNCLLII